MNANIREIRGIRGQSRFRRVTTSCQTTKKLEVKYWHIRFLPQPKSLSASICVHLRAIGPW
jgi:hypothetical protein